MARDIDRLGRRLNRKVAHARKDARRKVQREVLKQPTGWQVLLDAVIGAAAGALGTYLMGKAQSAVPEIQDRKLVEQKAAQQRGEKTDSKPATELAAKKALEPLGVQVDDAKQKTYGQVVHWGYGATWGALYGMLNGRVGLPLLVSGAVFGLGLWAFGDEIAVPKLGLSKAPEEYPLDTHVRALAAHLAYGTTMDASFRLMRKVLPIV